MPDSFFASKSRKRKRSPSTNTKTHIKSKAGKRVKPPQVRSRRDEELDSDETPEDGIGGIDDLELRVNEEEPALSDSEDQHETPAEMRLRLAKVYLETLKEGLGENEYDAADIDRDIISARLQRDVLDQEGKVYIRIADTLDLDPQRFSKIRLRGHRLSLTSTVTSSNCRYLFTAGKEGSIIKWDLYTGTRLSTFPKVRPPQKSENAKKKGKRKARFLDMEEIDGHTDEIWSLALSTDGKYLASGGKDRRVGVWDVEKGSWLRSFRGHKDTISSLTFRKHTLQLYSASHDRTVKIFDLSVMGYVETLFGHQDSIVAIDALRRETAVTCGGRDKSVRFWKVLEETQLIFRGGIKSRLREVLEGGMEEGDDMDEGPVANGAQQPEKEKKFAEGSIDCVAMVDESTFVSGGDSGTIALWIIQKKKPVFTVPVAHGLNEHQSETEGIVATPRWITALACLPYSDFLASGSWEGSIRLWKVDPDPRNRRITLLATVPAPGFVNSLQLLSVPPEFERNASWAVISQTQHEEDGAQTETLQSHQSGPANQRNHLEANHEELVPVLVVAGLGQEARTGRWIHLTGNGASNAAVAFVIRQKEAHKSI